MAYTKEFLLDPANANTLVNVLSAQAQADMVPVINTMSNQEQTQLLTALIVNCPYANWPQLLIVLGLFSNPDLNNNQQLSLLAQTYWDIKCFFVRLGHPGEQTPKDILSEVPQYTQRFAQHPQFVKQVMDFEQNELLYDILTNTKIGDRSPLCVLAKNHFPNSSFASNLAAASTLLRDIERLLLQASPDTFFTSRDFNPHLCVQFIRLVDWSIGNKIDEIGQKLNKAEGLPLVITKLNQVLSKLPATPATSLHGIMVIISPNANLVNPGTNKSGLFGDKARNPEDSDDEYKDNKLDFFQFQ